MSASHWLVTPVHHVVLANAAVLMLFYLCGPFHRALDIIMNGRPHRVVTSAFTPMSPSKIIIQAAYCCLTVFASVFVLPGAALDLPPLVPAVHSFTASGSASAVFRLSKDIRLIVDEHDAQSTRDNGLTLIPPTLLTFAQTFKTDLETLFPRTSVSLSVGDTQTLPIRPNVIAISLTEHPNATYVDGSTTTEGYELQVSPTSIRITASGSKGAFWATRTLLQGLVLTGGAFPQGTVVDQPDWRTRGFMLGRCLYDNLQIVINFPVT